MSFKRVANRKSYKSKIFELEFRDYQDKSGRIHKDLAILNSEDAANVIALTPNYEVIMIRQFRYGVEEMTIEVPGGLLESGEDPMISVKRELLEETGYSASNWIYLGKVFSNPVFQNNYIHHFFATSAVQTSSQALDPEEDITVIHMPVDEMIEKFTNGFFKNPHTVTAINLAMHHLKQIQNKLNM